MTRWIVWIGAGLIAIVAALTLLLPSLISNEGLVQKAEEEATKALGREVQIGSLSNVSVFPPRLTLSSLQVSSGEGFSAPNVVEVDEARLAVGLLPLLTGKVEIKTFILSQPSIFLETRADGVNNFTFDAPPPAEPSDAGSSSAPTAAPVVGQIEVRDGSLLWSAPDGQYEASNVDATLSLPPMGEPLKLAGSMAVESVPTSFELTVDEPWAMTSAQSSPLAFDVELGGNRVFGRFDALAEPLTIRGPMTVELSDLASLTPLLGQDLVDAAAPFGAMELAGEAQATSDTVALSGMTFSSAIASGGGSLAVDVSGMKPRLSGELSVGTADLRSFFPEEATSDAGAEETAFPAWSTEEMDFSGLQAANASVELAAERIQLPTYDITQVQGTATLQDGRAELALSDGRAFGGMAQGGVVLDARRATPRIDADMRFAGINFGEAAPALLSTERLTGRGTLTFDFNTQGKSEAAWVNALDGTANAEIEEGSIAGVSLSTIATTGIALVQQLQDGGQTLPAVQTALTSLVGDAVAPDANTAFDLADFGITIEDGAVSIGEAKLLSETFRGVLGGTVQLPDQGMDLSLKLSAKAPEETGYREFRLPVAVRGTFNEPRISLDTEPLARELVRGAASDALGLDVDEGQSLEDAVRERATSEFRNLLGGLTGRGRQEEDDQDEDDDGGRR